MRDISLYKELEPNFNICIKKNLIIVIMFMPQNVGTLVLGHEILVQIHCCHYCIHLLQKITANQTKQQSQRREHSNLKPLTSQREHLDV
jgi:hypothetical protein